jgi:hypothetical protein
MNEYQVGRDELAAMAMSSIANGWNSFDKEDCKDIAETSYRIADAMIACKKGYYKKPYLKKTPDI